MLLEKSKWLRSCAVSMLYDCEFAPVNLHAKHTSTKKHAKKGARSVNMQICLAERSARSIPRMQSPQSTQGSSPVVTRCLCTRLCHCSHKKLAKKTQTYGDEPACHFAKFRSKSLTMTSDPTKPTMPSHGFDPDIVT